MVFNDSLLKAISWTLVHSVWQGFLLALLAGLVILLTKKSASALRYNLFAGLFLAFIVTAGLTFNYEFQDEKTEVTTRLNFSDINANAITGQSKIFSESNLSDTIIDYLNHNANLIVMFWFLIFSVKCFGVFKSLSHVYRVRNYKTQAPPEYWSDKLAKLSRRIQLKKQISLLESRLVKVPSVVGFFKPVILIPVGLLSNLPHDQIEAILLHELAHIRRKDYFVNLIQSFAEIVFFFNPGLLWLSSLLKDERENCCDDIAIGITQSKSKFIHALVSFEEYNLKQNQLAMGFGGNKNHLLNRARRIIHNNNKSLNAIEKTFLSVSLILVAVIMIACSNTKTNAEEIATVPKQQHFDSIKANLLAAIENANAQKQDAIAMEENKKVCVVDREAHPEALTLAADNMAREADEKARVADDKARAAADRAAAEDRNAYVANKKAYEANAALYSGKSPSASTAVRNVVSDTKREHSIQTESTTTTSENDAKNGKRVTIKTGITGENLPDNINVDQLTKNIISDLISANVIVSVKNLSYKLSDKSLIVNSITQPVSILNKLRERYVKSKDIAICYNYEYNGNAAIANPISKPVVYSTAD